MVTPTKICLLLNVDKEILYCIKNIAFKKTIEEDYKLENIVADAIITGQIVEKHKEREK